VITTQWVSKLESSLVVHSTNLVVNCVISRGHNFAQAKLLRNTFRPRPNSHGLRLRLAIERHLQCELANTNNGVKLRNYYANRQLRITLAIG